MANKSSEFILAMSILGIFCGLAWACYRDEDNRPHVEVNYSASDRKAMDNQIASLPEVRKLPPVSKMGMPPKKGIHWLSLAKVAAETPDDGFTEALNAYEQGRLR